MSGADPQNVSLIVRQADSLKLTRKQADSISALNRVYVVARFDWTPVAKYLAGLPGQYDRAPTIDIAELAKR
jgi:hypothetical protein